MSKSVWGMIALVLALTGCDRPPAARPPDSQPPAQPSASPAAPKGVVQQSIEGFTGKTAVDHYKRTESKIKAIGAEKKGDYEGADIAPK